VLFARLRALLAPLLLLGGLLGALPHTEGGRSPLVPTPGGARAPSAAEVPGVEAVVASSALARRGALEADLERAVAERCDVWLCELKAAAIDTVAPRARAAGARLVFLRNRPAGVGADLDAALVKLWSDG